MARFYKTASANPLDYMFQANVPLMERVLSTNDKYITENLNQADKMEVAATSFPYLQSDSNRAKAISDDYSKNIDNVVSAIRSDPAKWRTQLAPMREMTRKLQSDMTTGEISKITGNYSQYKKVSDFIDAQVSQYGKDGKGISADRAKAYKEHFLNSFSDGTKYNPNTGEYNSIKTFEPMANIDIRKLLGEELDKIKSDKTKYQKDEVTGNEWYFNDKTHSWEGVTPEKILGIVSDRLNNPQLMDYLKQDSQVGLIKGVYDDNGNFINPYNYNPVPRSVEESQNVNKLKAQIEKTTDPTIKQQLQNSLANYEGTLDSRKTVQWNRESYLAPIMRGLVNENSYSKIEDLNKLRNNSKGQTQYVQGQTNFRQGRQLQQTKDLADAKEKGINDRFERQLEFDRYKWDNPHTTTKGTSGAKKGSTKPEEVPKESSVSRLATNSFEDWTTTDANGQTVKVLSNEGLTADINNYRTQLSDANTQINNLSKQMGVVLGNRKETDLTMPELINYNNLKVQKESLEKLVPKIQSDLNSRRKWYQGSVEATLSNNPNSLKDSDGNSAEPLTAEEIALYKKYDNDREAKKLKEEIGLGASEYLFSSMNTGTLGWMDKWLGDKNDPQYKLRKELTDYISVKKKVDTRRNNFLAQMRYTPIDTDAINVGKEDGDAISKMIFENPQGLRMFDNTGNRADNITLDGKGISWFSPKGDNYNMSFAQDKDNLINYMAKHNVTPIVEQVGNTTKIGSGNAIVKISFKDPNKEIPSTPFYVELTPELQKQIGTRLAINKNEDVKKIANTLNDDEANDLRRQLITPTIQRTAGATDNYDPVTFTIFVGNGDKKIPFQVTKFAASDGQDHLNITGTKDGVQIPLPNTQSGVPGWFNGSEDFINYIKSQRANKQ